MWPKAGIITVIKTEADTFSWLQSVCPPIQLPVVDWRYGQQKGAQKAVFSAHEVFPQQIDDPQGGYSQQDREKPDHRVAVAKIKPKMKQDVIQNRPRWLLPKLEQHRRQTLGRNANAIYLIIPKALATQPKDPENCAQH